MDGIDREILADEENPEEEIQMPDPPTKVVTKGGKKKKEKFVWKDELATTPSPKPFAFSSSFAAVAPLLPASL